MPFYEISGADSLIEHGRIYIHAYKPFPPIFTKYKGKGLVYELPTLEAVDGGALDNLIEPVIHDLCAQEWNTALTGSSYLCDNEHYIKLAAKLNPERIVRDAGAFVGGLKHNLPRLFSTDAQALLLLRERESEAFFVYRDKLRKLLTKTSWSKHEVDEIFRDEILPEVNLITKKVHNWKINSRQSIGEKILFGTGAVALGLYAGVLPENIGQIVAALGGTSAIGGGLMDLNKSFKEKDQARANDFYFLWRAEKG